MWKNMMKFLKLILNIIKLILKKIIFLLKKKNYMYNYLDAIKDYLVSDFEIATEPLRVEWNRSKPEFQELVKSLKISFKRFLSLSWRARWSSFIFLYYKKRWELYITLSSNEKRKKILKNLKILGWLFYYFFISVVVYILIFKVDELCQYPTGRPRFVYLMDFFTNVIYSEFLNYLYQLKKDWYQGGIKWPMTLGFLIFIVKPYYEAKLTLKWKFIGFFFIILYIYLLTLGGFKYR